MAEVRRKEKRLWGVGFRGLARQSKSSFNLCRYAGVVKACFTLALPKGKAGVKLKVLFGQGLSDKGAKPFYGWLTACPLG